MRPVFTCLETKVSTVSDTKTHLTSVSERLEAYRPASFCHALFSCTLQILCFYRLKVCENSVLSMSVGTIFPTAKFACFASLCHISLFLHFTLFHYYIYYGDP